MCLLSELIYVLYLEVLFSTCFLCFIWFHLFSLVCYMALFCLILYLLFFQIYIYMISFWLHFKFAKMLFNLNSLCIKVNHKIINWFLFMQEKEFHTFTIVCLLFSQIHVFIFMTYTFMPNSKLIFKSVPTCFLQLYKQCHFNLCHAHHLSCLSLFLSQLFGVMVKSFFFQEVYIGIMVYEPLKK